MRGVLVVRASKKVICLYDPLHALNTQMVSPTQQFRNELEAHTRAVIRKISKHYDIPVDDLVRVIYQNSKHVNKKQPQDELEYVIINETEYLFHAKTKNVFTFEAPHELVGKINKENELIIVI